MDIYGRMDTKYKYKYRYEPNMDVTRHVIWTFRTLSKAYVESFGELFGKFFEN